jgi:hypothetical protein
MKAAIVAAFHNTAFQTTLLSLVNVAFGFLLAQLGGFFTGRRERKKVVSQALTEALEVRNRLFALEGMVDRITDQLGNVAEHQKANIRVFLSSLLPKWDEIHVRYEGCITTLAGIDPLLAYHLRSKDSILPVVNWINSVMGQDPKAAALVGPVMKNLLKTLEPLLNKSILLLAQKKSWWCWYRTRRLLNQSDRTADDAMLLLKPLTEAITPRTTVAAQGNNP